MRIYSKKAFEFENSEGEKENVKMMDFATVPDWVESTTMFKLALAAEEIVVVNNKEDEIKAENVANSTGKTKNKAQNSEESSTDQG